MAGLEGVHCTNQDTLTGPKGSRIRGSPLYFSGTFSGVAGLEDWRESTISCLSFHFRFLEKPNYPFGQMETSTICAVIFQESILSLRSTVSKVNSF